MSSRTTVWSLSFFPILLTYFIDNFGQAIILPTFTILLFKKGAPFFGYDASVFNRTALLLALTAAFPLARIVGAPFLGALSDQIGRKRVFLTTILGGIVGYTLTGWGIHSQELVSVWTGRIIGGFFAGNLTLCLAAITDITRSTEDRMRNFGIVGTIGSLGFIFALLVGVSLSNTRLDEFFHPEIPFFLTALLSCINLFLISIFFKESHLPRSSKKLTVLAELKKIISSIKIKKLSYLYGIYFLFMLSSSTSLQFLSTYLFDIYKLPAIELVYAFLLVAFVWAFANFVLIPILARRFSPRKTLFYNLLLVTLFLFITMIPHQPLPLFLTFFSLASIATAICWTTGFTALSLQTPHGSQGSALGLNQALVAISFIVGPIIGEIIAHFDIHGLYLLSGSFSLIAAVMLFHHATKDPK